MGFGLYAEQDFEEGEEILQENPIATANLYVKEQTCGFCSKPLEKEAFECEYCKEEFYCCESCRIQATHSFHRLVCNNKEASLRMERMKGYLRFGIGQLCKLPILTCKLAGMELLSFFYKKETRSSPLRNEEESDKEKQFTVDSFQHIQLLSSVSELYSFVEVWNLYRCFFHIASSFIPKQILNSKFDFRYFMDLTSKTSTNGFKMDFPFLFSSSLPSPSPLPSPPSFFLSLQGIPLHQLDSSLPPTPSSKEGMAIFQLGNLLNHSCSPNADFRVTHNIEHSNSPTKLTILASRKIKKGQQIYTSYLPLESLSLPFLQRNQILAKSWGFDCNCSKCTLERN